MEFLFLYLSETANFEFKGGSLKEFCAIILT